MDEETVKVALMNGLTAGLANMGVFQQGSRQAIEDAVMHSLAAIAGAIINLAGFLPTPAALQHITVFISDGILYALGQYIRDTSPFHGLVRNIVYGTVVSLISDKVTQRLSPSMDSSDY